MSGTKRYPTRMHEVLGVEAFEQFQIKGVSGHFFLTAAGQICSNEAGMDNNYLVDAINHGIIRKPRLSEEQVKKLHAALLLGFKWLTVNSIDELWLFGTKPRKFNFGWGRSEGEVACLTLGNHLGLSSLVSWSDPEPLDIVQTLKAAGVEVE